MDVETQDDEPRKRTRSQVRMPQKEEVVRKRKANEVSETSKQEKKVYII